MKPINVSVDVDCPREEVLALLDVLANHEAFTDHMLVDWSYDGAPAGVGAHARMRSAVPGRADRIENGRRRRQEAGQDRGGVDHCRRPSPHPGHLHAEALPGGRTRVRFELCFVDTLRTHRLAAPLLRGWLKLANDTAMRRLGATLGAGGGQVPGAPAPASASLPGKKNGRGASGLIASPRRTEKGELR